MVSHSTLRRKIYRFLENRGLYRPSPSGATSRVDLGSKSGGPGFIELLAIQLFAYFKKGECRMARFGFGAVLALALVVACGGTSGATTAPKATPTTSATVAAKIPPITASLTILDLDRLILVEQDMPEGFALIKQGPKDIRQHAREWSDPEKWLDNYENWGRVDGFFAKFESEVPEASINMALTVYRTDEGAQEAFRHTIGESKTQVRQSVAASDTNLIVLEELENPGLGDESVSLHVSVSARIFGTPTIIDNILVSFRKANVIGSANWITFKREVLLSEAVDVAKKQLDRLS